MGSRWWRVVVAVAMCVGVQACDDERTAEEGTAAGECADMVDNDGDGLTDCVDPSCSSATECAGVDGGPPPDGGGGVISCMLPADCPPGQTCGMGICIPDDGPPVCTIADCMGGSAATCDGAIALDCTAFGASCADFSDPDGNPFSWCDCGMLTGGQCVNTGLGVSCEGGIALVGECPAGTACMEDDSPEGFNCYCDNVNDGVCPDPVCTDDPDCGGCTPSCGSAVCGDNGCGGSCGSCPLGQTCSSGSCVASCTPSCSGRSCGGDGCGGSCGTCSGSAVCNTATGQCETDCTPSCASGQTCGPDGCGGTCGSPCPSDRECYRCPSGATCAVDTYTCRCPFFDTLTYTFDASALDWTDINGISISVNHIAIDGTRGTTRSVYLTSAEPTDTVRVTGCEPNVEVRRNYSMRGGVRCEYTDTVMRTDITIPQPTLSGSSCSAPAL